MYCNGYVSDFYLQVWVRNVPFAAGILSKAEQETRSILSLEAACFPVLALSDARTPREEKATATATKTPIIATITLARTYAPKWG